MTANAVHPTPAPPPTTLVAEARGPRVTLRLF
jgi:hypothetical protein